MKPAHKDQRFTPRLSLLLPIGALLALGIFMASRAGAAPAAQAPQVTPTPLSEATPDPAVRLAQPVPIPGETQLNRGAYKYWGVCMACHGDRGQGLTDEWRTVYGEDSNCWGSGCHGKDHPPQGFEIPKTLTIPAVAGAGRLGRFANAQELYDFIHATMPWWNPGSLSSSDAWAVTAQILRMNGVMPEGVTLNETNASAISVHYLSARPADDQTAAWLLSIVLGLAAIGFIYQSALERRQITVGVASTPRRPNFYHHLHPPSIPALQARWRYTLGAGGLAIFLSFILLVTGLLEMFYYSPTPGMAAKSVEAITYLIPFGRLIRGLHFWSAQALVVVMGIHLLRVALTGAYVKRRRSNFLIGLGLMVFILALDFTGYLLRWDEGIRWALVIGTNLLKTIPAIGEGVYRFVVGGPEPSASSLVRFYTWHVFALTLGFIILGAWHIFRIRRDGGIAVPPPAERNEPARISRFELADREVIAMLVAGILLLIVVILIPAPIGAPILDMASEVKDARAPWFFLWVQQMLKLGDPFVWGVLAPSLMLLVLALIPYVFPAPSESNLGRWLPRGGRLAQTVVICIGIAVIALTILFVLSNLLL